MRRTSLLGIRRLLEVAADPVGPRVPTLGRFRIHECLGMGGLAAVYRAFDPERGHDVALKLLLPHAALDPHIAAAVPERGGIAPGSITRTWSGCFEAGRADGLDYLAMESVHGRDPRPMDRTADGPIPARIAARIVAEAAEGARFCHERGVIHRDISPANILLFPRETRSPMIRRSTTRSSSPISAWPRDFRAWERGWGRQPDGDRRSPRQAGIPRPGGAPRGMHRTDPRTDVFAIGVLLYRLAGRQAAVPGDERRADPEELWKSTSQRLPQVSARGCPATWRRSA